MYLLKALIFLVPLLLPVLMVWSVKWASFMERVYNIFAYIALYLFQVTVALYVTETIMEGEIYNTTIHGILLNPFFIVPGGYFGVYVLYQLLRIMFDDNRSSYSR